MSPSPEWIALAVLGAGGLLYLLRDRLSRRPSRRVAADAASPAEAGAGSDAFSEEVIPGQLLVNIVVHTLDTQEGPIPCWTYVSEGLWALGQKEIVFTIKRRPGERNNQYPRDLLQLYSLFHQLAAQKNLVDVGGFTLLGPGAALAGRSGFEGVLYAPPQVFQGVRVRAPSLTGLILTAREVTVGREYGVVRVMGVLGKRHRYFPTAPWADRDRPELTSPEAMEQSILSKMTRASLDSASVRQEARLESRTEHPGPGGLIDQVVTHEEARIVLRLRPGAAKMLKRLVAEVPADSPLALLVGPDPGADACLTWEPGQKQPFAISMPLSAGTCIAGSFISFVPMQEDDGGMVFEDGFAILLRDVTWQRVRQAFETGRPLSVPASGPEKLGLEIVWVPEVDPDFSAPLDLQVPGYGGVQ